MQDLSANLHEVCDPVAASARERFGLSYLYPLQRLAIANILDAECAEEPMRQLVLLPTGAGKSLCFQLPALFLSGPSIVVYPLLALMADQQRRLEELSIPSVMFRGGQSEEERRAACEALRRREAKVAIANPEVLGNEDLLGFLADLSPSHLAIDEAHCVTEWGETFRPAYLRLGAIVERLAPHALSAFTATASPEVVSALEAALFHRAPYRLVVGNPDRPNLFYAVVPSLAPIRSLEGLVRELPKPLIVFCASRKGTELVAETLCERLATQEVRFYHAGLERAEKQSVEEWFFASTTGVLVATCAYGLGVDKKNIRTVVHYEAPSSVEAYLQEAGRAGRDGLPALAVLIAGPEEGKNSRENADAAREARRAAFRAYARGSGTCRRAALLGLLGASLEGPCAGCDRCVGKAIEEAEGRAELVEFLRRNPRRFGATEAAERLRGRPGLEPPQVPGGEALSSWRLEDIAAAIGAATGLGIITEVARGPWKGRLAPARRSAREA